MLANKSKLYDYKDMANKDLLERVFPGSDDEPDLLLGIPDYTGGQARLFFEEQSPEDRELTQWYLEQQITPGPGNLEYYLVGLAKGYHLADTDRRSELGIQAALDELQRLGGYVEIFIAAEDFFPMIKPFTRTEIGEDLGLQELTSTGWSSFLTSNSKPFSLEMVQFIVESQTVDQLEMVTRFIQDPTLEPEILEEIERLIKSEQAFQI